MGSPASLGLGGVEGNYIRTFRDECEVGSAIGMFGVNVHFRYALGPELPLSLASCQSQ